MIRIIDGPNATEYPGIHPYRRPRPDADHMVQEIAIIPQEDSYEVIGLIGTEPTARADSLQYARDQTPPTRPSYYYSSEYVHELRTEISNKQYRNSKLQDDYSDIIKRLNAEKAKVNRLRQLLSETVDHLDSLIAETKNMLAADEWGLDRPAIEQRLREQIKRIESR